MKNKQANDLIITALEGGSNYWYYLPYQFRNTPKWMAPAEYVIQEIHKGESYKVLDNEDGEYLGELNAPNIVRAKKLLKKDYSEFYADVMKDEWDAETADVFFQLLVMGELVYG